MCGFCEDTNNPLDPFPPLLGELSKAERLIGLMRAMLVLNDLVEDTGCADKVEALKASNDDFGLAYDIGYIHGVNDTARKVIHSLGGDQP